MRRFPLRFTLRSVRTRLMLWNIGALAVILAAFCGVLQVMVRTNLLASVDRELEDRIPPRLPMRRWGPSGQPFPGFARPGEPEHAPPGEPGQGFHAPGFPGPDDRPPPSSKASPPHPDPRDHDSNPHWPAPNRRNDPYRPRILTTEGGQPPYNDDKPWDRPAFERALRGEKPHTSVIVDDEPLRVYSRPIRREGAIVGVVQVAHPLTEVNHVIQGMNSALLALIPVALLLAGFGGAALTDRALRPVRRITQTAEQIGAQDLSQRLPVIGDDEFSRLAATFNGMLARLEIGFQQQKELVRELELLIEQQQRFTGDASHELRTPLTIIKANASLSLSGAPDQAEYRESMEEIDRAATTMTRLVQDLLLLTRSDGGQLGRNVSVLPARELIERAARAARKPDSAPIRLNIPDDSLCILGAADEIARLFSNLLENAVRYTPAEGEIVVTAFGEGDKVVASVSDTGVGVAPEHLPHLCERFYRVDASRSRPDGGTGLGLSICKSIVEAHGGAMILESAVGKGATIRLTLPRAKQIQA